MTASDEGSREAHGPAAEYLDVLIIGAGISGIDAAYRINEQNRHRRAPSAGGGAQPPGAGSVTAQPATTTTTPRTPLTSAGWRTSPGGWCIHSTGRSRSTM